LAANICQFLLNGLVVGSSYTLVAIGLTMIFGVLHIPNFGHGNLFMLGAFFALFAAEFLDFNYFFAGLVSVLAATLIGVATYWVFFRPIKKAPPINLLISAIGVFFVYEAGAIVLSGGKSLWGSIPIPWSGGLHFAGMVLSKQEGLILLLTPILIFLIYLFLYRTKTGSSIRAVAQDPLAAALMGIKEDRVMVLTFALASLLAGLAGTLVGAVPGQAITPTMAYMLTVKAFIIVIFGGLGSLPGAIIAGYLIGITESLGAGMLNGYLPVLGTGYSDAYAFILLLVFVMLRPMGLFGEK
jgi:branched-chain amino acid transport system permease protein